LGRAHAEPDREHQPGDNAVEPELGVGGAVIVAIRHAQVHRVRMSAVLQWGRI